MQTVRTFKRLCMAAVSGAMLLTMVPEVPADAAGVCSINTNKTYQYIRGFGGIDLPEWQGYSLSDAELARAFGNGSGQLGLSVLRVYINPDRNQWNKGLKTAQYAAKAGATIFATPWEPPAALAESGGNNGKLHLPSYNYGAYATHLNDFGNYMKNNGVNLYSISVQNEPDYAHDWTYWTPMETTNFIANYGDKITSAKLMSPETFQYGAWGNGRDYYNNILNNQKANANIDVFGTHFYGTPRSKMDFPALENSGREIWMTEVYVPNSNANSANNWPEALDVAENIHNGLVVGNMSVYTWWYIKRSYSLIEQNGSNGAITKRGYMMGQYSKYVRPGDYRIDCTESPDSNLLISAYKHSDTQIEIVAINKGNTDVSQQFSVDGRTITDVDRYRTTSSENLACTSNMEHGTSSYWSYLPAKSVSTFVVKLKSDGSTLPTNPGSSSGSTEVNPDSNGYYFHDTFEDSANGWEARGGNTELTLSGRHPYAGTNALLVQKRESAWQGVQKTLDSSTYKPGQKYSFSVLVDYEDGEASQDFLLSMQYKDSSGTTKYLHIAEGTTYPRQYLQLKNPSFQIPSDASDVMIYVETKDVTGNFYIDEAIVAKEGVNISGPAAPTDPGSSTTTPTTTTPVYPEKTSLTYNVSSRQFRVSWTSVPNAQAYGIGYYSGGKWKVFTDSISSSATSWTSPKIPSGKYKVVILAKVNGQWETKSINSRAFTVTIS